MDNDNMTCMVHGTSTYLHGSYNMVVRGGSWFRFLLGARLKAKWLAKVQATDCFAQRVWHNPKV